MKAYIKILRGWLIIVLALGFTACSVQAALTPTMTSTGTTALAPVDPNASVLEVTGSTGTKTLTLEAIKALPATEGYAGTKSSTGKITLPLKFKGIALKDLAAAVGGMDNTSGFNLVAKDGYAITFSSDQVNKGIFTAYDPATGDELKSPVDLTAILAYEQDGKSLNPDTDGTLHLVIVSNKPNQVTDGHWAVKWVTKVESKSLVQDWTLYMHGAINFPTDRASFQSCSAPQCHGTNWTDDKAQKWDGVPLWRLVGSVDDQIRHDGPAFNDALADSGYKVDIVSKDGSVVTFDSARIKRNNNIMVAYQVNGNPLIDKYFPLRLVGTDLKKEEMVGAIEKIVVHVSPPATPTVAASSGVNGSLLITGLVEKSLTLSEADLRALDVKTISADQPKVGKKSFTGILLSSLLKQAQARTGAKTVVLTASDGYSIETDLALVNGCIDCMVAFTDKPGSYFLVMPGQPGNLWVKNIAKIETK